MRYSLCVLLLILSAGLTTTTLSDNILGDIVFPRKEKASLAFMPASIFSHWKHRTRFKCYACHDQLFLMQTGADEITMDALSNGKFCAVCHNGKIAFQVGFTSCERCHVDTSSAK